MSYECVLPFPTDDPQFVYGFEAGRIYQDLLSALAFEQAQALREHVDAGGELAEVPIPPGTELITGGMVYAAQAEMMLRIAEAVGVTLVWEEVDELWATVTFKTT